MRKRYIKNSQKTDLYNYVNVLPLGNYCQAGQTVTLSKDITNAKMLRVRSGWSNGQTNSGIRYDFYSPVDFAADYCTFYIIRGELQTVTFNFPNGTTLYIYSSSNASIGIRQIDAVF